MNTLKEDGQPSPVDEIAGPVLESPEKYEEQSKQGGGFWDDVNGGYMPEDLVLAAPTRHCLGAC